MEIQTFDYSFIVNDTGGIMLSISYYLYHYSLSYKSFTCTSYVSTNSVAFEIFQLPTCSIGVMLVLTTTGGEIITTHILYFTNTA